MRGFSGLAVAAIFALAGCVDAAESAQAPTASSAAPQEPVGSIRGVVVDDSLLPVEGVAVALDKGEKATTDVAGAFEFLDVPVGEHVLSFSKAGYLPKDLKVTVIEGEEAQVRGQLISAAVDSSFHETMNQNGILFCGISTKDPFWHPANNSARGNPCVLMAQAGQESTDRAQIRWYFKFTYSSGFWSETKWEPSGSFNKIMSIIWTPLGDDGARTPGLRGGGTADARESPMRVRVPIEMVNQTLQNFTTASCNMSECMLLSYHYVGGETLGPSYPVDAGIGTQQRYEVWVTVFYNGPLPEEFTIFPAS